MKKLKEDFETKLAGVLIKVGKEEKRVADAKVQQEKKAEARHQAKQQAQ